MPTPKYKSTSGGDIIEIESNRLIKVHDYEVQKQNMLSINEKGKGEALRVRRSLIDEEAFSFGKPVDKPKAKPSLAPTQTVEADGITFTRQELVDLYTVGKKLVDLTLPKLIDHYKDTH